VPPGSGKSREKQGGLVTLRVDVFPRVAARWIQPTVTMTGIASVGKLQDRGPRADPGCTWQISSPGCSTNADQQETRSVTTMGVRDRANLLHRAAGAAATLR
jgi:hypothetical protein